MADEVIGGISASISVDDSGLDAGMAKLQSAIERTKGDISGLNDALRSGTLSAEDYATKLAKSEASLKSLERASASLQTQLSSQAAAQMSASQAAEAATAAQVAAQARAISSSGAWGAVSTASAANIARLRAEERAMTVLPVSGLQSSGLRVQDQLRAEDAAAAQRARRRQEYVDDVKKGEEARRRAESGMRGGGFGGGGGMLNLAVIGQTLDDMQYVGEMGLRPIINNLMQIHPLLGLAALGFDQMRKHGAEVVPVLESLSKNLLGLNLDVGGLMGDEDSRSLEQKFSELDKTPSTLAKFWDDLKTNIQMIPDRKSVV